MKIILKHSRCFNLKFLINLNVITEFLKSINKIKILLGNLILI